MGPEFNLTTWLEYWLTTSGINTLEPIFELEDGKLTSLKIKQGLGMRGQNRLKTQKLDIGLYSREKPGESPIIIRDVVVKDYDPITDVDLNCLPDDF